MSKKIAFNKRNLAVLTHTGSGKSTEYSDAYVIGLKIDVSPSGRKIWYFRYTFDGRKSVIRIGEYSAIDLEEARSTALQHRAEVDRGFNPAEERRLKREEMTFKQYAEDVYLTHVIGRKKSAKDDVTKLRTHMYPCFGDRKLSSLTAHEISNYHVKIKESRSLAYANRHLALLKRMLGLAVTWGHLTVNPATGIKLFKEGNTRQTYLSKDEVRRVIAAMNNDKNPIACAALKILLLTGVRRQEALSAQWSNVDLNAGVWLLPHTKSGRPRHVQLSDAAILVLQELRTETGDSIFVFPGRDRTKPLQDPRKTLWRVLKAAGVDKPFRIHDTRHTFASLCVQSGVSLYTVQHLLGHSQISTTQIYSHLDNPTLRDGVETVSRLIA
ncbi:tyrosine-type recombinase/integrase [Paraburkholderia tropica]|uniref:tyrosine-type recombinase/integrase n=1 Tax=Paraburkholderia tropica TaxID=92647 RepID=UPI002ABE22DC|nr:tyrosine-type recombinase/integrase [Paraburkholderia tropica]